MRQWYDKFPGKPKWLIDFCVAYACGDLANVHLLVDFGFALVQQEARYREEVEDVRNQGSNGSEGGKRV